jgi:hypothetical protein
MVEMDHPVSVSGHLPEEIGIFPSQDFFLRARRISLYSAAG